MSDIESRIDQLLAQMTLEEKVGQLNQCPYAEEDRKAMVREGKIGSFLNISGVELCNEFQRLAVEETRLGIPLIYGRDVIHGYRTVFPIPLGQAASWNPEVVKQGAEVAAREARANGVHWTFTPMVDIARDPRWGRIAEGFGEDPYLCSQLTRAAVEGYQGADLADPERIVACAKHFVGYGAAEGGRDYNTAEISERTLREVYLPSFQAAVDAGVGTLMSAFNEISGIPASANRHTLTEILRDEWGFDGFVVSDWASIGELVNHGIAADRSEAAREAILAGVDMEMDSECYLLHLADLVRTGAVPEAVVDEAVRRVLRIKFRLGLFERPYTDPQRAAATILQPGHLEAARDAARQSLVLLKNERGVLPLAKTVGSLALIGPLADNQADLLGCWAMDGKAEDVVTVLTGLREKLPATAIRCADGSSIEEAVQAAKGAEMVILAIGEPAGRSGEANSLADIGLPAGQEALVEAVLATGKPVAVVLFTGRPLTLSWLAEHVPAILLAWHPGVQGGHAIADALVGDYNPGGKLPASFPRVTGQVPVYYNHKNTGRPQGGNTFFTTRYIDQPITPLFPFGFGLSYTTFSYSNLAVTPQRITPDDVVTVSADITNTGDRAGDEVVQLYIRDLVGSTTRPVKELKGFARVTLAPGETRRVTFTLGPSELCCLTRDMHWAVEPGDFKVWVGSNSDEGLEGQFTVEEDARHD